MYIFAANTTCINLYSEARIKKNFPKVLASSTFTMLVIYMIYALIAYFCYQGQTNEILTISFNVNVFTSFIVGCVCFNCLISYPVQILVAFEILEEVSCFRKGTRCT